MFWYQTPECWPLWPIDKRAKVNPSKTLTERFHHLTASGQGRRAVIINKLDYNNKLIYLVNDVSKFKLCDSKQSDRVKLKINKIAGNLRTLHPSHFYKIPRKGDYYNGHLYGLSKVHKNLRRPPIEAHYKYVWYCDPWSGSSHQHHYINTTYVLRSSDELSLQIKDLSVRPGDQLVSLDMESLFTNVPVPETILLFKQHIIIIRYLRYQYHQQHWRNSFPCAQLKLHFNFVVALTFKWMVSARFLH